MRAGCAIFASIVALVVPRFAVGQAALPGREMLRLDWRAPPGCPSGRTVRDAAIRSSGAAAAESTPLDVRADVEHGARWRVTIQTSRDGAAAETRSLEAASCSALAEATAVVLGVALIPAHALTRTEPSPTDSAAAAPAAAAPAAAATPDPAALPSATPSLPVATSPAEQPVAVGGADAHHFAVGIELAGDAGGLPAVGPGARIALAWTPRAFRVELYGSHFSGQSRTTDGSAAGARFGLFAFGGRGCWAALRSGVELGPCAGIDIQHMTADGFGAATNFDARGTWAAAALGGLLRVPLTRIFALRADLDAIGPFSRPRFVVENDGAVHKPAGIGARAAIGAELNFL